MVDEQTLSELKVKYPTLFELTVNLDEDGTAKVTCYLRKLDRVTYSAVNKLVQSDEMQATEVMLKNLWIAGDPVDQIISNFDALRGASAALVPMLKPYTAELKKI